MLLVVVSVLGLGELVLLGWCLCLRGGVRAAHRRLDRHWALLLRRRQRIRIVASERNGDSGEP